jgi:hypothetical protein
MQNRRFNFGPLALTNTYTTNILNPATATGGVNGGSSAQVIYLRKITVVNKTVGAVTFRLFKDVTGGNTAGKEIAYDRSVPANDKVDLWFNDPLILTSSDFLVGGASAATSLTIMGEGEVGVAGP